MRSRLLSAMAMFSVRNVKCGRLIVTGLVNINIINDRHKKVEEVGGFGLDQRIYLPG